MATNEIIHLQAIRSKDVLSGSSANLDVAKHFDGETSPKLPTSDQLEYGDIALNIAPGYEVISIKNYNGDIVYLPFNLGDRVLSLEELQDYIYQNFNELSGSIITFNEEVHGEIQDELNSISAKTLEIVDQLVGEKCATLQSDVANFHLVQAAALAQFNQTLGFDRNGKYNFTVEYLSGRSVTDAIEAVDARIDEVEEKITDQVRFYDDKLLQHKAETNNAFKQHVVEVNEALSGITDNVNNFTNEIEERVSAAEEKVSNLEVDLKEEINNKVSSATSDLKSEIQSDIRSLSGEVNSKIDEISGSVITKHDADLNGILLILSTISASTSESITAEIEKAVDTLELEIRQHDITQAAAIAKFKQTLGFDVNGGYNFDAEYLVGRTIGEAVEAVDAKVDDELIEINRKYNQLVSRVINLVNDQNSIIDSQNEKIDELVDNWASGYTEFDEKIETLSGNVDNLIEKVYDDIDNEISTLSDNIESANTKIDNVSISLNNKIGEVEESISEKIASISGDIENNILVEIDEIKEEVSGITAGLEERLDGIDGKISAACDSTKSEVLGEFDKFEDKLKETELVHAAAFSKINSQLGFVDGKYESEHELLSGRTLSDAVDALYNAYDEVDWKTTHNINKFKEQIEGFKNDIKATKKEAQSIHDELDERVGVGFEALSAETDNKISNVINAVNNKIDSLSAASVNDLTEFKEEVEETIGVNSEQVNQTVNDAIDSISGYVEENISQFEQRIVSAETLIDESLEDFSDELHESLDEALEKVDNAVSGINDTIVDVYDSLSGVNDNINVLRNELLETEIVRAAATSKINNSLGFDNHGNYNPDTEGLSGRTVVGAIDYLNMQAEEDREDYTNKINKLDKQLKEQEEHFEGAINIVSGEIDSIYDTINNGHLELVEQHTKDIESLSAEVTSKSVVLKEEFEATLEETKSEIDENIDGFKTETLESLSEMHDDMEENILSARTDLFNAHNILREEVVEFSGNITEYVDGYNDRIVGLSGGVDDVNARLDKTAEDINANLYDDEIVHAAAFAKLNQQFGFTKSGRYQSDYEALSGRNITNAIDFVYDYVKELDDKVNEMEGNIDSINTLHMRSVTYEQLRRLVRTKQLELGQTYKLTNYQAALNSIYNGVATTRARVVRSGAYTNHGFYIVVKAIGHGTLSENALAMAVTPDEPGNYFANSNVEAWNIKYSIFNDESRFDWATPNGFGVIYYMKDEFGNEAPYDFKNIKFKYSTTYKFTFNGKANATQDLSLTSNAHDNVITGLYNDGKLSLNKIVLIGNQIHNNIIANTETSNVINNTVIAGIDNRETTFVLKEQTGTSQNQKYFKIISKTIGQNDEIRLSTYVTSGNVMTVTTKINGITKETQVQAPSGITINSSSLIGLQCSHSDGYQLGSADHMNNTPVVSGDGESITVYEGSSSHLYPYVYLDSPTDLLIKHNPNSASKGAGTITLWLDYYEQKPVYKETVLSVEEALNKQQQEIAQLKLQINQLLSMIQE